MPEKITDTELKMLIDLYKNPETVHGRAIYLAAVELQKYRVDGPDIKAGTWTMRIQEVPWV